MKCTVSPNVYLHIKYHTSNEFTNVHWSGTIVAKAMYSRNEYQEIFHWENFLGKLEASGNCILPREKGTCMVTFCLWGRKRYQCDQTDGRLILYDRGLEWSVRQSVCFGVSLEYHQLGGMNPGDMSPNGSHLPQQYVPLSPPSSLPHCTRMRYGGWEEAFRCSTLYEENYRFSSCNLHI